MNEEYRFGVDPDYPEPAIGMQPGFSQVESDGMRLRQMQEEAIEVGREASRVLGAEEALRQRYLRDGGAAGKAAAAQIEANRRERRG